MTGRSQPGPENPSAVLTEVDVREIWRRLVRGDSLRDVARDFGVHHSTIQDIATRDSWTELDLHPALPRARFGRHNLAEWSDDEVQYLVDHTQESIAEQAKALGRTEVAVRLKRSRLGLSHYVK